MLSAPIIGERSSSTTYHLPDSPSDDPVSPPNRVPFASEAAAQAAGYRLAGKGL